ncbi:hypothetical protein I601_4082 [Nocardioides dokdonensis FR1436]|uniref:Uncharacterized protein n=1 Tax=Nocardioides dokdonensis FR1436 TaxID=1300347 RepID=A0A1A9GQ49_9ACTN|nr:hypothetical protein [Nocardioides dokdonensis]ANH40477.1 hypothetical protein I601_4082 [Nocardioides dokdonensis FR1436]
MSERSPEQSTPMEDRLTRELDQVADGLVVPPMPVRRPQSAPPSLRTRWRTPLLVAAPAVLAVAGLALVIGRPGDAPAPVAPEDPTISVTAPTVPYVVDQRLYVDGTQVPGAWWSVESRNGQWLALQQDGSWWSGGPGRDFGPIAAEIDQPPVLSPGGGFVAFVDLSTGRPRLTGFDTRPAGEGLGSPPIELARTDGGVVPRVRAVTDDGYVVVQGRRTSLMWRAWEPDRASDPPAVVDLATTAPEQQVLQDTAAGLVVVDGMDSDPQSVPSYLAELSENGVLTRGGTLPTYDDLEVSPGGTRAVFSPDGTLGGEVSSVGGLSTLDLAGGDEAVLEAPQGWRFAVGTWVWEDDRMLVAVLQDESDPQAGSRLARCDVDLGECRDFPAPGAGTGTGTASAEDALATALDAAGADDRDLLGDAAVLGDAEWEQLVDWTHGEAGSVAGCRDNGGGTRDCEIVLTADPGVTYYAILEPTTSPTGWRISYVGIADG